MRSLAAIAIVTVCAAGISSPSAAQVNEVRILSVKPAGPVQPGRVAEFIVDAEIELASAPEAAVQIAFNDRAPDSFRTVATQSMRAGRRTLRVRVSTAVPRLDRGSPFLVRVNLGPWTTQGIWQPFAEDTREVPLDGAKG